jgi:hypothetical protein
MAVTVFPSASSCNLRLRACSRALNSATIGKTILETGENHQILEAVDGNPAVQRKPGQRNHPNSRQALMGMMATMVMMKDSVVEGSKREKPPEFSRGVGGDDGGDGGWCGWCEGHELSASIDPMHATPAAMLLAAIISLLISLMK